MIFEGNQKLAKQSRLLSLFKNVALVTAVVVYAAILYSAILGGELVAYVPLTSVLLGVLPIHFSVRLLVAHLALLRDVAQQLL